MPGRNDRCPCGSGLKYKKCCLNEDSVAVRRPSQRESLRDSEPPLGPRGLVSEPGSRGFNRGLQLRLEELTFASFVDHIPEDRLPFAATKAQRLQTLVDRVNGVDAMYADFELGPEGRLEFNLVLEEEQKSKGGLSFTRVVSTVVTLAEREARGTLELEIERDGAPISRDEAGWRADAAVLIVHYALSSWIDQRKTSPALLEAHQQFQRLNSLRQKKLDKRAKLLRQIQDVTLESLCITLPSIAFSGGPLLPKERSFFDERSVPLAGSWKAPPIDHGIFPHIVGFTDSMPSSKTSGTVDEIFVQPLSKVSFYWSEKEAMLAIAESVRYRFSDGCEVSAREILATPYAALVPPDLLPGQVALSGTGDPWASRFTGLDAGMALTDNELNLIMRLEFFRVVGGSETFRVSSVKRTIGTLIRQLGIRLERNEIRVNFELSDPYADMGAANRKTRRGIELRRIEIGARDLFAWHTEFGIAPSSFDPRLESAQATFSLRTNLKSPLVATKYGFIEPESGSLWLYPTSRSLESWRTLERSLQYRNRRSLGLIEFKEPLDGNFAALFSVTGQEQLIALRDQLEDTHRAECFPFVSAPLEEPRQALACGAKAQLSFDRAGRFCLVRRLFPEPGASEPSRPYLFGFSEKGLEFLGALKEGLPFHFGLEARELATSTKQKRDFELKLVKHLGIVRLLALEALSARFEGHLTDGTPIGGPSAIRPALETKILPLMGIPLGDDENGNSGGAAGTRESAPRLERLCTKATLERLDQFIQWIYQLDDETPNGDDGAGSSTVILPEGECAARALVRDELRLFHQVLRFSSAASNGGMFTKSRLNLVEKLFPLAADEGGLAVEDRLARCGLLLSRERVGQDRLAEAEGEQPHVLRLPYFDLTVGNSMLQALTAFQPLTAAGFELFAEGHRLEELSESEFRSELVLRETAGRDHFIADRPGPVPGHVPGQATKRMDWFELNPRFFFHGEEMDAKQASRLIHDGMIEHEGRYFLIPRSRLPSLQKLNDFWEKLRRGSGKSAKDAHQGKRFSVGRSQVLEMLALRASGIKVTGGARWEEICRFYDELGRSDLDVSIPSTVHAQLKGYQKRGVERLYQLHRLGLGAILADDMGLGKTLQTLAFLEMLRHEGRLENVLIVVPTSLTFNWLSEAEKFTPRLPIKAFSPKAKDACTTFLSSGMPVVLVTTYGLFQEHRDYFLRNDWRIAVFDEAQNLKNLTAQRTATARELRAEMKICLTGTPLENHLGEFYSLLDLVVPGSLGDFDEFRTNYVNTPSISIEDIRYLRVKARPLLLRRTKKEILTELPEKIESKVMLTFEQKQKKIYRDIAIGYNDQIQQAIVENGESKCQLQMLTALLRLRQACSDPAALPGVNYPKTPPKIETLVESLKGIVETGESALVFTQFIPTLERTRTELSKADVPTFTIHGGVSRAQREKILEEFNCSGMGTVLLMTLKTGGVGLNLTKASYVFHLEPWWNPAVENQATDRAHRMGQSNSVQVFRYIMHDSVEEKIEQLKARKQSRFDAMFADLETAMDGSKTSSAYGAPAASLKTAADLLTKRDFDFLLGLGSPR